MNVIGYVISYESDPEKISVQNEIQRKKIEAFCKIKGLTLLKILIEPDESRSDFRPELVKLLNDAPKKKFSGVVVHSFERLAQEEDIRDWILSELKKYDIAAYSTLETSASSAGQVEDSAKSRSIRQKVRDLPSLPEVVTKITELVQNPKSNAAEIGKVISQDSGLTSRVLRLVNSAYYGFPKQISSIQHAVMILGFTTIKGLVLSSSIFRIFTPKDPLAVGLDYKKFWKHSLLTAIASKKIYRELFFEDDENIFSAAILHDIGKLILDQYDHSNYANVLREVKEQIYANQVLAAEQKYCELTHPDIGSLVAEGWNLPEVLTDVIRYHHKPLESENNQKITTVVYIGNIISQLVLELGIFTSSAFDEEVLSHIGLNEGDLAVMFDAIKEEAGQLDDLESFFK